MAFLLAAIIGYLLGAIPVGLVVGRMTRGVDIREYGSHRTGATNALRTLGTRAAALVFVLDVAKGAVAVLIARAIAGDDAAWAGAIAGVAAIVGHNWSVFIGFTGGRGVATSTGGLAAVSPLTLLAVLPVVIAVVARTRFVSLASITGAVLAPIITAGLVAIHMADPAALAFTFVSGALVVASHADNIVRLRAGTERRIGQKEEVRSNG